MFQPDEELKNLALEIIHGLSSIEKTQHLRALWSNMTSQEKIDDTLLQILHFLHVTGQSNARVPLGFVYESLNNEDWERLGGHKDSQHSSLNTNSVVDTNALYDMLSPELRSFLKNLDNDLTTEFGTVNIPEISTSTAAEEKGGKGRKRKIANVTADTTVKHDNSHQDTTNKTDNNQTNDSMLPSAMTVKGVTAEEGFTTLKRRSVTSTTVNGPHYKASDILLSLLCDLRIIADDLIIAERICNQLHDSSDGLSVHAAVLSTAEVNDTNSDPPLPMDSPALSQLSRTVTKVSAEYIRTYDQSIAVYDMQKATQIRENYERYRKRWELLLAGKVSLSDVPIAADRVPNPFAAASGDYANSWSWLRGVFTATATDTADHHNSSSDNSDSPADRERGSSSLVLEKCENKELQAIASNVLDTIFKGEDHPCGFFESVRRSSALLAHGRNFVLVDKGSDTVSRSENTIHRGLLTATILAVFNGSSSAAPPPPAAAAAAAAQSSPRPPAQAVSSKRKDLARLIGSQRLACGMNKDRNYGPLLIITRLSDIEAWEASCREVLTPFNMEIMPYYGSEKDLGVYRAYLRNIASSYYGSATLGTALHCDRSPCHVIVTTYETLLLEVHHFKEILWYFLVFDEPWGFVSSDYYLHARNQVLNCLRSRQRCLVCSSLSGPVDSVAGSVNKGSVQIPDIVSTLTLICPLALGMNFLFDPDLALPSSNKRRWSLPLRGTHSTDYLEIDNLAMFHLHRALAGLTVVCSPAGSDMLPYTMISPLFNNEDTVEFRRTWELCENMHKVAPYLLWHGYELALVMLPVSVSGGQDVSVQRAGYEHKILHFSSQLQQASQQALGAVASKVKIILYHRRVTQTQQYFDAEFATEVSNCNLKLVGATIASSTGVITDRDRHNQRLNSDLKEVAKKWSLAAKGRAAGIAPPKQQQQQQQQVVRSEAESKVAEQNDREDMMDVVEDYSLPSSSTARNTYQPLLVGEQRLLLLTLPQVAPKQSSSLSTAAAAAAAATSTADTTSSAPLAAAAKGITTHPAQQSSASGQALTFAEELSKGIITKLPFYYVSIIVQARVRFLGVFTTEQNAKMVFEAAYTQREAMLGATTTTTSSSNSAKVALSAKFKGRVKDIKLSDGSYISDEMYNANMTTNDELYDEIRRMIYPAQQALHDQLVDWSSFYHDPPGYALLRGSDGSATIIGGLQLILGRASDSSLKLLTQKLDQNEERCTGVIFNYHASISLADGRVVTAPAVHVSNDRTVSKYHVLLEFSPQIGGFQVTALSAVTAAEEAVFVDGQEVRYGAAAVPLQSKSVLKIGHASFIFCLPINRGPGLNTNLLQLRSNMLKLLIEQREMRRTLSLPKEEYIIAQPHSTMDEITFLRGEEEEEGVGGGGGVFEWNDEWISHAVENAERRALKGAVNSSF